MGRKDLLSPAPASDIWWPPPGTFFKLVLFKTPPYWCWHLVVVERVTVCGSGQHASYWSVFLFFCCNFTTTTIWLKTLPGTGENWNFPFSALKCINPGCLSIQWDVKLSKIWSSALTLDEFTIPCFLSHLTETRFLDKWLILVGNLEELRVFRNG